MSEEFWKDSDFSKFESGVVNGVRVNFPFRVLSEEEYQFAKKCVNEYISGRQELNQEDEELSYLFYQSEVSYFDGGSHGQEPTDDESVSSSNDAAGNQSREQSPAAGT